MLTRSISRSYGGTSADDVYSRIVAEEEAKKKEIEDKKKAADRGEEKSC